MMLEVRTTFEAAHKLECMPEGHKCRRLHGHSYEVKIILRRTAPEGPGAPGLLVDAGEVKKRVRDAFDHQYLNERLAFMGFREAVAKSPTVENLVYVVRRIFEEAFFGVRVVGIEMKEGHSGPVVGWTCQDEK